MKKVIFSLSMVMVLFLVGCEQPVTSKITLNQSTITLYEGDTCALTATIEPKGTIATITWVSSNTEVATVDANGMVVALAEGTTTIQASAEGIESAECIVNVEKFPTSFPRKFLIEHFTGEGCGYCPGGMYSIVNYTQQSTTPHIWVSHHTGYMDDEYTIPENAKIGKVCGVQGAPNMALNRTKLMGTSIAFHPGYLVENDIVKQIEDKCETTAEASVIVDNTYNADTRELNITVSGRVIDTEVTEYLLTVLIKENGLVGKQADYTYSWKTAGYKEFMHPCIVRDVVSESPYGDTVKVEHRAYKKTLTYTVPVNWVAENCCVVAYITPLSRKPVINAEEIPLVKSTTGGVEYLPFGITETQAPTNATNLKFDSLSISKPTDDKLSVQLIAKSSTRSEVYGPVKMVVTLEFNTTSNTLPADTLEFAEGNKLNTFSTGTVDYATRSFGGSILTYYLATSMQEEVWQACHIWRIKSGTVVVNENGNFTASGKLYNGKSFAITYTLPE